MNDAYYEQIVKGKAKPKAIALLVALILIGILSVVLMLAIPFLMIVVLGVIVILHIYAYPRLKVEYEYTVLNSEFDISSIYNKAKRKKALSLDLKTIEVIAPIRSASIKNYQKVKDYASTDVNDKIYGIVYSDGRENVCIKISPDGKMLKHIKNWTGMKFQEF